MNLTDVGGEPQRLKLSFGNGETMVTDAIVTNVAVNEATAVDGPGYACGLVDYGEMVVTFRQTGPMEMASTHLGWSPPLRDDDVAVIPGGVVQSVGWIQPFAYGLAFLLLLWGCMVWEKWIGWVMR